jgi:hypothetical protein
MFAKEYVKKLVRATYSVAVWETPEPTTRERERLGYFHRVDQGTQTLLRLKYQEMLRAGAPLPSFDDVEFRSYSQNGEAGILLYIFSLIGTTNKKVVEICVADGTECNAANLIINSGWHGLLFDGSEDNIARGKAFYARHRDTWLQPPTLMPAWITRDNVNDLIFGNDFGGEIDLLSIDIDGNDFWIWKAIECIRPRVVVVEHNSLGGASRAVTIPYDENFVADLSHGLPYYLGATLPAFVKLGHEKGYRLVGGERLGFNAFFLRDGVGEEVLPEVSAGEVIPTPPSDAALELLAKREFVEV